MSSLYCQEQPEQNPVETIFNEIKQEIAAAGPLSVLVAPKNPTQWDLHTFLQSLKADEFKPKINQLALEQKNRLMQKIFKIPDDVAPWQAQRDFLALIIEEGGDINANSSRETFLGKGALYNDLPAVTFALNHKADTRIKSGSDYPLELTKDLRIAQLLVAHGGLEPIKNSPFHTYKLLSTCMQPQCSYQLLKLYKDQGLNFNLKDTFQWTLLHALCAWAPNTKPFEFFEKFLILYQASAINVQERNNKDETALDSIKQIKNQNNVTVKLARALLEGLENNPGVWKSKLLSRKRTFQEFQEGQEY